MKQLEEQATVLAEPQLDPVLQVCERCDVLVVVLRDALMTHFCTHSTMNTQPPNPHWSFAMTWALMTYIAFLYPLHALCSLSYKWHLT